MLIDIIKFTCKLFYYIVDIFVLLYFAYYIVTGIFAFFGKKNVIKKYKAKNKLAIIIPARNEEVVITHLLDSLNKQNYPKELFDIFVIPNNCTDNTKRVSLQRGAKIIECNKKVVSKGEVLKYTFEYMEKKHSEYDAYIIFDADNIVHPDFLARMNDTLCSGYKVAQGYRDSKNPSDTWISCCYSLFYWIQNYFFNQARMNMGWSSSINGTGFMISKKVLDEHGFNTVTMTEDVEFAALCALHNERIAFVNDAITYDEQPLTFKQSWKQRKRWSMGTLQCMTSYCKKLLKVGITRKIPQGFDMCLFFLAPVAQLLSAAIIIALAVYNILDIRVPALAKYLYDNKIISVILGYFATVAIAALVVIIQKKKLKRTFKGILTLAIFMLTWIPINILCIVKKDYVWEPIVHNRKVDIDSIVELKSK